MNGLLRVHQTSEIHTVWFVGNGSIDVLAMVYRDSEDSTWQMTIRLRAYTAGPDPDADDLKRGFTVTPKDEFAINQATTLERLLNSTQRTVNDVATALGPKAVLTVLPICGGPEKLTEEMRKYPWSHQREEWLAPQGRA